MNMLQEIHDEPLKAAADAISGAIVVAAWADYLPSVATLITIVWGLIRIWETDTVQRLFRRTPIHKETDE